MEEDRSVMTRSMPEPEEQLRYGKDEQHVADLYLPPSPTEKPLVLYIHGGWWRPQTDRIHARSMAFWLKEAGWPVASIEYSRVPGNPEKMISDVHLAAKYIPGAVGADRVVLVGHSAGGHLALHTAVNGTIPGLVGTVALAPVADLRMAYDQNMGDGAVAALLGCPAEDRPDLDPKRLPPSLTPVRLIHGTADLIAPIDLSESYVRSHPDSGLVSVDGAGHFSLIDPDQPHWMVVVDALESLASQDR